MADLSDEWQTYHDKSKEKKQKRKERKVQESHGTAAAIQSHIADPSAGAFVDFDRAYAEKQTLEKAISGVREGDRAQGDFAGLVNAGVEEGPVTPPPADADHERGSSEDERAPDKSRSAAAPKQPKKPKAKKPKLSVAQVAEELDVELLQSWMAEVQLRYSLNETAQVQALSDWLLTAFREAKLDLSKLLAQRGVQQASKQPLCDLPNTVMNALASFVASVSEEALAMVVVPLTAAVVNEAAATATAVAPGKGKAGLLVALAVILYTRPQVLVPAAAAVRAAAGHLNTESGLLTMLWVINQAALAEPAVGVAVWVRLVLPQLLGAPDLACGAAPPHNAAKHEARTSSVDLHAPLDSSLQSTAVQYIDDLLQQLDAPVAATGRSRNAQGQLAVTPCTAGADVVWEAGGVLPTVPGSTVEALSRAVAGVAAAGGGGGSAAAGGSEGKRVTAARAAAAAGLLAPLLPSLAGLAAGTRCEQQYSEWMLLAFESAGLSAAAPNAPDSLVLRSAAHIVACVCSSGECFHLWESKHKASLRGSARVLAALEQHPQLLQPLRGNPSAVQSFRQLLAALPARHRTFLATGKGGWQGACAKVAEHACQKLPCKLPLGGWRGAGGRHRRGSSSAVGQAVALFGGTLAIAGMVAMLGVYRHAVADVMQACAGKDAAQQLDAHVLAPVAEGLQQLAPYMQAAQPWVEQVQQAAAPLGNAVQQNLIAPMWLQLQRLMAYVQNEMEEVDTVSVTEDVDMMLS